MGVLLAGSPYMGAYGDFCHEYQEPANLSWTIPVFSEGMFFLNRNQGESSFAKMALGLGKIVYSSMRY